MICSRLPDAAAGPCSIGTPTAQDPLPVAAAQLVYHEAQSWQQLSKNGFLVMHLERSTVELQQRRGAAANDLPDFAPIFCDALPDVAQVGNAADSVKKLLRRDTEPMWAQRELHDINLLAI